MKFNLVFKSIFFTILMPGVGVILIPYLIIHKNGVFDWPGVSIVNGLAFVFGLLCMVALLHCIWRFAVSGKGTLAPMDPPKHLVVGGLYRYTRNPMYLAVFGVLISEAILFRSVFILIYCLVGFVCFHVFVITYEEPKLRALFGQGYLDYCQSVPRWGVVLKPFKQE